MGNMKAGFPESSSNELKGLQFDKTTGAVLTTVDVSHGIKSLVHFIKVRFKILQVR